MSLLRKTLDDALRKWGKVPPQEVPAFEITIPPSEKLGDYATNAGILLAKILGKRPEEVAEELIPFIEGEVVEKVEVAKGGFINFFLSSKILQEVIRRIITEGESYGFPDIGNGRKIQIEFVSANPTGPLSVAHGRGAVIGDVLANLFSRLGYQVVREYYINDFGSQIDAFAKSIEARYYQLWGQDMPIPPDGYKGEYVQGLAMKIRDEIGDRLLYSSPEERLEFFKKRGVELMVESHRQTLKRFGVEFDSWFRESSLHSSSKVGKALDILKEKGLTFERDGAIWFHSTFFGDDRDRVLVRSNGSSTYFAADIAYHMDKHERGFSQVIDIWGPDHYGYVGRMLAGVKALGYGEDWLKILIFQVVRLVREGEVIMMSKREGEFVTLDELINEVGKDAGRFFYLLRTVDSPLDFDMTLAVKQAPENPVYYVQYAHTRIYSILREAERRGFSPQAITSPRLDLLKEEKERALIKKLGEFPSLISVTYSSLEPYNIVRYSLELSRIFHNFYESHRVIVEDRDLAEARLHLMKATLGVLKNCIQLLGVEAPEKM